MKIYTKTGDKGQTSLYDGTRVDKCSLRVESYGTLDELSSFIALAASKADDNISNILRSIQRRLFYVSGQLATTKSEKYKYTVRELDVEELEKVIDFFYDKIDNVNAFILPGTNEVAAIINIARTICRRAERILVKLQKEEEINDLVLKYINRLSDALYAIGRYSEQNIEEIDFEKSYNDRLL